MGTAHLDASITVAEAATEGIRYWEPRRLVYNGLLAAVVLLYFAAAWPTSGDLLSVDLVLEVFVLAVLANVFYSAAYVPDVFAQLSTLRGTWLRTRWVLLLIGTTFAATLTRFISMGMFIPHTHR